MGDLNSRHTSLGDHHSNSNGTILAGLLDNLPLIPLYNEFPTFLNHRGDSVIDHIIIHENLQQSFDHHTLQGTCITSDHIPILAKTDLLLPVPRRNQPKIIHDYNNTDWASFRQELQTQTNTNITLTTTQDIDCAVKHLTDTINTATTNHVPTKRIPHDRPTIPLYILNLIRSKRHMLRQYKRTRDPGLKTEWNRLNATIRLLLNQHRERKWADICSKLDSRNGKQFWTQFKKITGAYRRPAISLRQNNSTTTDPTDISNIFATYFESVHQFPEDPLFNNPHKNKILSDTSLFPIHQQEPYPPSEHPLLQPITEEETHSAIFSGKNSSPGPDNIPRKVLRQVPDECIQLLTKIFNRCLSTGHYPVLWKTANVVVILKPKKNRHTPESYRPISLLNTLGKTYEKILHSRLYDFVDLSIPTEQSGFRRGRSTNEHSLRLATDAIAQSNRRRCTLAIFLDIEKAFDKIWHSGLLYKLHTIGCPFPFIRIIKNFLTNRLSHVQIMESHSRPFTLHAGVPQGSVLSPLLYSIYCHDIPKPQHPNSRLGLYADDTALWVNHSISHSAQSILQQEISRLQEWMELWRIKPNPSKTQLILFTHPNLTKGRRIQNQNIHISLWNQKVHTQKSITYLGFTFTYTLSWTPLIQSIINQTRRRTNLLKTIRGRLASGNGCSPKTLLHTYKTFIRPIILYRTILLSSAPSHLLHQLTTFERSCLRMIHSLHPQHPSDETYRISNILPITEKLQESQTKYITKSIVHQNTAILDSLKTPFKPLGKTPTKKLIFPPATLLQNIPDLPVDLRTNFPPSIQHR